MKRMRMLAGVIATLAREAHARNLSARRVNNDVAYTTLGLKVAYRLSFTMLRNEIKDTEEREGC